MKKTLIAFDIHENLGYIKSIEEHAKDSDHVICVGDYFDSWEGLKNAAKTAEWVASKMDDPKYTLCIGNHDTQYFWPGNSFVRCSGYRSERLKIIRDVLGPDPYLKFTFYKKMYGWLISHAGLSDKLRIKDYDLPPNDVFFQILNDKNISTFLGVGWSRGGNQSCGGLTWCDWNKEFVNIQGVSQIVGHTSGEYVRYKKDKDSISICGDTKQADLMYIYEDGSYRVFDV